jgi:CAAX prenyl protease-like protein
MSEPAQPILEYHKPSRRQPPVSDFYAYLLPMGVFLVLVQVGITFPSWYVTAYAARTALVAGLLVWLWPRYTPVRWNHLSLGVAVGVIGIVQWVGMQLWLQSHFKFFAPSSEGFDPTAVYADQPGLLVGFCAMRIIGAVVVVPVMEELFWRDFLWRSILAPNDFKLAAVGEWDWKAYLIVAGAFSLVHGNWWLTAIVWGLMVGALLVYTKSLGACIVAHATTNLLLAAYVLYTREWHLW